MYQKRMCHRYVKVPSKKCWKTPVAGAIGFGVLNSFLNQEMAPATIVIMLENPIFFQGGILSFLVLVGI